MEHFSPELRAALADPQRLDRLEQLCSDIASATLDLITPKSFSPVAKIPVKARVLFQSALRRLLDLANALIRDSNVGALAPVFLNARAALETALVVLDVFTAIDGVTKRSDKGGLAALDERLMRTMLGVKSDDWGGKEIEAINVLTLVDRWNKKYPGIRTSFDGLSEHAHSNWSGVVGGYSDTDFGTGEVVFFDYPLRRKPENLVYPLTSLTVAAEITLGVASEYERLIPKFVALCEEAIHDSGHWPLAIPFPRPT